MCITYILYKYIDTYVCTYLSRINWRNMRYIDKSDKGRKAFSVCRIRFTLHARCVVQIKIANASTFKYALI